MWRGVIEYKVDGTAVVKQTGNNSNRRKTMTDKEREELLEEGTESEVEGAEGEPTPESEPEEGVEADTAEESPATSVDEELTPQSEVEESPAVNADDSPEKMLTQSQVNEIVGRARQEGRESAMRELYERYGVSGDEELNNVFGLGQVYHDLDDEFKAQGNSYKEALAENALLKSRADESRWEDIKLILGGKGLDITMENIESLIPSHPEWRTSTAAQQTQAPIEPEVIDEEKAREIRSGAMEMGNGPIEKPATVRRIGGEATVTAEDAVVAEDQEARLKRLFGI